MRSGSIGFSLYGFPSLTIGAYDPPKFPPDKRQRIPRIIRPYKTTGSRLIQIIQQYTQDMAQIPPVILLLSGILQRSPPRLKNSSVFCRLPVFDENRAVVHRPE